MSFKNYIISATWLLPFRIILAAVYGLITSLRNLFFDSGVFKIHKVKTTVISVGNISVGGSGKTILVQALVEYFLQQKKQPSILSRGYGRSSSGLVVVSDKNELLGTPANSGDEPFLMAQNFPGVPVVVSEDRFKGAQFIEDSFSPDVIILDDGFQHRRLHRDMDILLIDFPENAKTHLLPWGRLRENHKNIGRADHLIFSKKGLRPDSNSNLIITLENEVIDSTQKHIALSLLKGEYGLFAGLGNPAHFFDMIQKTHLPPSVTIAFDDHVIYGKDEYAGIEGKGCDYWITTQKDFVKLSPTFCQKNKVYYIRVNAALPTVLLHDLKHYFN